MKSVPKRTRVAVVAGSLAALAAIACGELKFTPHIEPVAATTDAACAVTASPDAEADAKKPSLVSPAPTPQKCLDCVFAACANEIGTCAADPACLQCAKDNATAGCPSVANWAAISPCACKPSTCGDPCAQPCSTMQ